MIGMGGSSRNGVLMPTGFYPLKFWGNCMSRETSPKELFLILAWLFFLDFCYATNVKHKLEFKMHFSDNASMEARYVWSLEELSQKVVFLIFFNKWSFYIKPKVVLF